jgi:Zn ribbon nucleic-acid-binding protein
MARTCPKCTTPNAVAVLTNEEGIFPFACTACGFAKFKLREGAIVPSTQDNIHPCGRPGCDGSRTERTTYDAFGRWAGVENLPCDKCAA